MAVAIAEYKLGGRSIDVPLAPPRISTGGANPDAATEQVAYWVRQRSGNDNPYRSQRQRMLGSRPSWIESEERESLTEILVSAITTIRSWRWMSHAGSMLRDLENLRSLRTDWNSYGSDPPNAIAIRLGQDVLLLLSGTILSPRKVLPSAEGGVGIIFTRNTKYADIECYNNGEMIGTLSDGKGNPIVFAIPATLIGINGAIARIREFLYGGSSEADVSSRAACRSGIRSV